MKVRWGATAVFHPIKKAPLMGAFTHLRFGPQSLTKLWGHQEDNLNI